MECSDYVRMWLVYCEYLRRRVRDWSSAESADAKELADTFKRAKDNLKECESPSLIEHLVVVDG